MNRLQQALDHVARHLAHEGADWALVGGFAVSARTAPRFTRDLDLAVAVRDDPGAEALVARLARYGYRPMATVEQVEARRLATVRLAAPEQPDPGVVVDLLFASSGIEDEVVAEAETLEIFSGVCVKVARLHHLLALKVLARDDRARPQDRVDLISLLKVASAEDIDRARAAVARIVERRFNRGKDLEASFESLLRETG